MALLSVRSRALACALALGSLPSLVAAQATTTGTVRGRVTDATSGRALPDAQVGVDGSRLGAITGANGDFTNTQVPLGSRTITVRRLGYQPVTRSVDVTAGGASTGDSSVNASRPHPT